MITFCRSGCVAVVDSRTRPRPRPRQILSRADAACNAEQGEGLRAERCRVYYHIWPPAETNIAPPRPPAVQPTTEILKNGIGGSRC